MTSHRTRTTGVALAAFLLLGAACSSDDDTDTTTTEPDPTTEPQEDDTTTSTTGPDDATGTSTTEPVELTASFRGVTADTIRVGFVDVDFERLATEFGVDVNSPDTGLIMEALIADLNDRGGINGRMVEVVVETFLPVGTTTADAACVKMVEDEQVFAVLGGFGGPGTEESNVCITGPGETILVGGRLTDERLAQSRAPWVTPNMSSTRRGPAFVDALAASGELDGLGTLGVHAVVPEQDATADVIRDALADAGATVALRSTGQAGGDQFAAASETEVMMERARADGVDSIVVVGVSPTVTDTILATDEFTVVLPNTEDVANLEHATFSEGNRMIGTGSIAQADDPVLASCIEIAERAVGDAGPAEEDDDLSYWTSTTRACQNLMLFEAIATEAGPDLTNESFAAAMGRVELPPLPVYPFASVDLDKPDARDTLSVLEWDLTLGDFVAIAGPFDVRE